MNPDSEYLTAVWCVPASVFPCSPQRRLGLKGHGLKLSPSHRIEDDGAQEEEEDKEEEEEEVFKTQAEANSVEDLLG